MLSRLFSLHINLTVSLKDLQKKKAPASKRNTSTNGNNKKVVKSAAAKRSVGGKAKIQRVRSAPMETSSKVPGKVTIAKRPTRPISARVKANAAKAAAKKTNNATAKPKNNKNNVNTIEKSLQTARAIVKNPNHIKQKEIKTLLESHEKKWINDSKFVEILKSLLF
jgi:hypothetical protein